MFRSSPRPLSLRRRLPLRMETLERRDAPAVFNVTNLNDSGSGSLRAAVSEANNSSNADIIKIQVIGTLFLEDGEMDIFQDVTIVGPGSGVFTIDASDNDSERIFDIGTEGILHVSISGMTLTNANGDNFGGAISADFTELILKDVVVSNCDADSGGAIFAGNDAKLVMDNCVITGNTAFGFGGGIRLGYDSIGQFRNSVISNNQSNGNGGGVFSASGSTLSIERSTIAGNTAFPTKGESNGGGLFAGSNNSLNIEDSTFSSNSASGAGGGIFIDSSGQGTNFGFTINNSTISGNVSGFSGGGIYISENITPARPAGDGYSFPNPTDILHTTITGNVAPDKDENEGDQRVAQSSFGFGGGVATGIEVNVVNSIIAGNFAGANPDVHTFDNGNFEVSFSLIQNVGTASIDDNGGNIFGQDPVLGPLTNNGGTTQTHALLAGSPAINSGDPSFQNPPNAPVTDQRGTNFARVVFGTTDMGAFEVQESGPAPVTRHLHAVGAGAGTTAEVKVFDDEGNLVCVFDAYPFFQGGVRVAIADMDGDGIDDVITSPGPNGGPHIQVFGGAKLLNGEAERIVSAIGSFFSYNPFFRGGVYVGTGDVNGDGRLDIITGADAGGGPHVIAWDNVTGDAIVSFYAYAAAFTGGVRVAGGDIDGDGKAEIITAPAQAAGLTCEYSTPREPWSKKTLPLTPVSSAESTSGRATSTAMARMTSLSALAPAVEHTSRYSPVST